MKTKPMTLSLALQGGGAFGAFTWGVLDQLLQNPDLRLDMASGSSAGAVNAVLLADGLATGDAEAARAKLARFWTRVGESGRGGTVLGLIQHAAATVLRAAAPISSPYQFNPLGVNPLRDLLREEVDFDRLRAASPIRLRVAATHVKTARARIFTEQDISLEAVLASSCLPFVHHAVEIEGEAYWDGGFAANPPLLPVLRESKAADVLLIKVMPPAKADVPHSAGDILARISEIAFTAPLERDLRTIEELRLPRGRLHTIDAADWLGDLALGSALETSPAFLTALAGQGRHAASAWRGDDLSARPSIANECMIA